MHSTLFCKKCGGLLNTYETKDGVIEGLCVNGCTPLQKVQLSTTEHIAHQTKGTGVIPEETNQQGFPHTCKQCGYEACEITDLGAQYSDESNIYLYRCLKCNHVERQADGTGNR